MKSKSARKFEIQMNVRKEIRESKINLIDKQR